MTSDRKKSILILIATFVVGVVIGALSISAWARHHYQANKKTNWDQHDRRRSFNGKLLKILKVDSAQAKVVRPIIEHSLDRFDSLQSATDNRFDLMMEQLKSDLKPHLSEEQMARLQKFSKGGRGKSRGDHRQPRELAEEQITI